MVKNSKKGKDQLKGAGTSKILQKPLPAKGPQMIKIQDVLFKIGDSVLVCGESEEHPFVRFSLLNILHLYWCYALACTEFWSLCLAEEQEKAGAWDFHILYRSLTSQDIEDLLAIWGRTCLHIQKINAATVEITESYWSCTGWKDKGIQKQWQEQQGKSSQGCLVLPAGRVQIWKTSEQEDSHILSLWPARHLACKNYLFCSLLCCSLPASDSIVRKGLCNILGQSCIVPVHEGKDAKNLHPHWDSLST